MLLTPNKSNDRMRNTRSALMVFNNTSCRVLNPDLFKNILRHLRIPPIPLD